MNTQAHVLLNYVALRKRCPAAKQTKWVILGGLLPDAPMFVFYAFEKWVSKQPEAKIWSELYYTGFWQNFIDVFNSIPLVVIGILISAAARLPTLKLLFLSMLLHIATDLPVHREDAHHHFFPFSNYQFVSPISYWDPAHYGHWFSIIEATLFLTTTILLWKSISSAWGRVALVLGNLSYIATYAYFFSTEASYG